MSIADRWIDRWYQAWMQYQSRSPWALILSLAFSALYGGLALHQGFGGEFIVQDDARQHVFWMQRFVDPQRFPNDLIADYFQSIAPVGYAAIYRFGAAVGIDPSLLNKLLPFGLGLLTTYFAYRVTLRLLPVPLAGFTATLLLNQSLWLKDDLVSGTSRAFAFPLFLMVLDGLLIRSPKLLWGALALQGLICPSYALVSAGLLVVRALSQAAKSWLNHPKRALNSATTSPILPVIQRCFQQESKGDWILYGCGLLVTFMALLPVLLLGKDFGPTVSSDLAKTMPEFLEGGRTNIFDRDWLDYWLFARGTNLIPRSLLTPVTLILGLSLPVLLWKPIGQHLALSQRVTARVWILPQLILASVGWFLLAHLTLFKLHLPSRYTGHSFRIVIAIAAGIGMTIVLAKSLEWWRQSRSPWRSLSGAIVTLVLGGLLIGYPLLVPEFPANSYQQGKAPQLYQFLQRQPITTRVASLSETGDDLPTFAGRSILTGKEYAVPYHVGYYQAFRDRLLQTIAAQYSLDPVKVQQFLDTYRVQFWLIDRAAFQVPYLEDSWLKQYPEATQPALEHLRSGQPLLIQAALDRCGALQGDTWVLLETTCLRSTLDSVRTASNQRP
ncbi:MAG: hypothetical protein EA001_08080 [Oscillatoriales cyanobacterium]|nr:MAG: hypothetical protein EA001_08080 [Oscillatoriales cyanobacterium]